MSKTPGRLLITIVAMGLLIGSPVAAQKHGKAETGPGTSTAARKFLEGRWSLLAFQVLPPGKAPIEVHGQGSLVYDGFGNLQWEIRIPPDAVEPLRLAGVPSDNGILSINGRAVIDVQAHTLTYVVKGQPAPGAPSGPLALNRKRYWTVEDNVLTLTTKDDRGRPVSVSKWQKGS